MHPRTQEFLESAEITTDPWAHRLIPSADAVRQQCRGNATYMIRTIKAAGYRLERDE